MEIYKSINNVMCDVGAIGKGKYNAEQKFNYRGVEDVMNARDMLSEIAKRAPLISVSDTSGYRIAMRASDVDDAMHAYNENKKRAGEILKRNEPLEKFIKENGV